MREDFRYLLEFVKRHEGLRLEAYIDCVQRHSHSVSCRRSIGYGTISYRGERITAEQAEARCVRYLEGDWTRFINQFPRHDKFVKCAMLDFAYQYGYTGMVQRFGAYLRARDYRAISRKLRSYTEYVERMTDRALVIELSPNY